MRLNGIKPIERTHTDLADIHEPSLTAVEQGLDRPAVEFGGTGAETKDQHMSVLQFAGLLGLIGALKTADVWHDFKAKYLKPRGEF